MTAGDVVAAIKKAGGPNLDKRIVRLPKSHIKADRHPPVAVHLHPEVNVEVALEVVARELSIRHLLVTTRRGHDRAAAGFVALGEPGYALLASIADALPANYFGALSQVHFNRPVTLRKYGGKPTRPER